MFFYIFAFKKKLTLPRPLKIFRIYVNRSIFEERRRSLNMPENIVIAHQAIYGKLESIPLLNNLFFQLLIFLVSFL